MKISMPKFDLKKFASVKRVLVAKNTTPKDSAENIIFVTAYLFFALLMAIVFCNLCSALLNRKALHASFNVAEAVSARTVIGAANMPEENLFSQANLFGSVIRSADEEGNSNAESFVLRGTLPGVGAWISTGGDAQLMLVRQQISGWTLEDVSYGKVLLSKDGESCALYMSYCNGSSQSQASSKNGAKAEKIDFSAVRKAEKGKDGFMPKEVVDKLVMNPYDEIAKMKMVPADGGGMKLEQIDSTSVLGLAGVQQGDVIKAINGVSISNLGDLTNAINSLMSGARFDVNVERGGEKLDLKYSVN